jgi:hypothetical protein
VTTELTGTECPHIHPTINTNSIIIIKVIQSRMKWDGLCAVVWEEALIKAPAWKEIRHGFLNRRTRRFEPAIFRIGFRSLKHVRYQE